MTSQRSMQTYGARMSRALQFQPGHVGGRVSSAQPVLHRRRIGVATVPLVAPLYWWKFDEASGDAVDAVSGVHMVLLAGATYHATALAPGSTYAVTLQNGIPSDGTATSTIGLAPGADGLIVIDAWLAGLGTPTFNATVIGVTGDSGSGLFIETISGGTLDFSFWGTLIESLATWADPAHIRWEVGITAGTSRILINDVEVSSTSGHTFSGWSAPTVSVDLSRASGGVDTTIDELKIYGVGA